MPTDVSLPAYVDLYLSFRTAEGLTPKTLTGYRDALRQFLATPDLPAFVTELEPAHGAAFLAMLRSRGISDGAISVYQRAVWTWFRWLYEQRACPLDISRMVKRVRVRDRKRRTASSTIRDDLLAIARDRKAHAYRNAALVEVLWDTGVRVNELAGVQLADIDLSGGTMTVLGKAGKRRTVAMGSACRWRITEYLVKERGREPGALFIARLGQPMSRNAMRLTIASLAESAGVTASCHDFRRACAARLLREGVSADDVARQLGHSSITMTLIYGEEGRTERAVAAFHAADAGIRPLRKAR